MNLFGITDFGMFCLAVLLLNAMPGPDTAYILAASATAFLMVKLAGGICLVCLGLRILLAKPAPSPESVASGEARSMHAIFWQAAATNVLNPKVILFFLAFIPQFMSGSSTQKTAAFLLLGLAFAAISMCWNAWSARRSLRWARGSPGSKTNQKANQRV